MLTFVAAPSASAATFTLLETVEFVTVITPTTDDVLAAIVIEESVVEVIS